MNKSEQEIFQELAIKTLTNHEKDIEQLDKKVDELGSDLSDLSDSINKIQSIKGEKGDKGEPGERGKDGIDGSNGIDGKDGLEGHSGPSGKDGIDGRDGKDGENGLNGKDGVDGLDGKDGFTPKHKWKKTYLSFQNPDGTWGEEVNLLGPIGPRSGHGGRIGSLPIYLNGQPFTTGGLNIQNGVTTGDQNILNLDLSSTKNTWGSVTGTLSEQTDLQSALDARVLKTGDTMTGALLFPDGSVAAPSIAWANATGTGFYSPNFADQRIAISINGSGLFNFQASGFRFLQASAAAIISPANTELLKFSHVTSAVNELTITNAATANNPVISATGDDTNIGIKLNPKGTGSLIVKPLGVAPQSLDVYGNLLLGGDNGVWTTRTNATTKAAFFLVPHYLSAEEPMMGFYGAVAAGTVSHVVFGGGSSAYNAANKIAFYTAPNTTTLGGTERLRIDGVGNVGIGETAPKAVLHLKAGTATAGTAPLKFTAGTNLTTPEAGVMEFDGNALAFTPVASRRSVSLANGVIVADTTVANTVTETTIYTEAISANELYKGLFVQSRVSGYYSTANAADTFTFRLKVGGVTIQTITSTAANVTNGSFVCDFDFTVRSSGASGTIMSGAFGEFNNESKSEVDTAATTVDTTAAEDVTVTVQWDNALAGNTLTITQGFTEFKGVKQA